MNDPISKLRELVAKWRKYDPTQTNEDMRGYDAGICADELEALLPALEQRERELRELIEIAGVELAQAEMDCNTKHVGAFRALSAVRAALNPTDLGIGGVAVRNRIEDVKEAFNRQRTVIEGCAPVAQETSPQAISDDKQRDLVYRQIKEWVWKQMPGNWNDSRVVDFVLWRESAAHARELLGARLCQVKDCREIVRLNALPLEKQRQGLLDWMNERIADLERQLAEPNPNKGES